MKAADSILDSIGGTPLVELRATDTGRAKRLYAKLERFNPSGSVKDRIALSMIEDAELRGRLGPGGTIVEATSGNTGIGLAAVGAVRGYRVILTMPRTMSIERRRLLRALGAELVLTPGPDGMVGAVEEARRIAGVTAGAFIPSQFENPANPAIHERTTGPEIWEGAAGDVDVVVAGIGTGGTITGVGRYLRKRNPAIRLVGVEPKESAILSGGRAGAHSIQGIGAGFVPSILDRGLLDEILTVSSSDASRSTRHLARSEGIVAGISSGAALAATLAFARRPDAEGASIVTILPDGGEKYLSESFWEATGDDQPDR